MAQQLSGGDYTTANFAIAGVFIARLLPAVFLGPIAGVIADKLDRRKLMVNCDILRTALYISIPIANNYFWLYTAMILVECITLFWSPAKEASVPNLVPRIRNRTSCSSTVHLPFPVHISDQRSFLNKCNRGRISTVCKRTVICLRRFHNLGITRNS
jgi:MFS family permease